MALAFPLENSWKPLVKKIYPMKDSTTMSSSHKMSFQCGHFGCKGYPTARGMAARTALEVWYHMVMESEASSLMIRTVVKAAGAGGGTLP